MRTLGLLLVLLIGVAAAALLITVPSAEAQARCDGSTAMKCAVKTVMVCEPDICVLGTADTVLLPRVMLVDVPGRLVTGATSPRKVKIVSVGHGSGRLMLHGEEPYLGGTGWNVAVDEASGEMVGAVLTRTGGYIMFGTCSPE